MGDDYIEGLNVLGEKEGEKNQEERRRIGGDGECGWYHVC